MDFFFENFFVKYARYDKREDQDKRESCLSSRRASRHLSTCTWHSTKKRFYDRRLSSSRTGERRDVLSKRARKSKFFGEKISDRFFSDFEKEKFLTKKEQRWAQRSQSLC